MKTNFPSTSFGKSILDPKTTKIETESKAATKIQKMYQLKKLWEKFTSNPDYYHDFTNDKIANKMYGKHVAGIMVSKEPHFNDFANKQNSNYLGA